MKKCSMLILFLAMVTATSSVNAGCKDSVNQAEIIILFSDRGLYIAGEKICFSAFLDTATEAADSIASRVLYCELITPSGGKIASGKFLIEDFHASGALDIPADLITGTYYIRAYTRNMRNYGPYSFSYIPLKVINPYRGELQETAPGNNVMAKKDTTSGEWGASGLFTLSTDKPVYSRRDTIRILIDPSPDFTSSVKGLALSVIPEATVSSVITSFQEHDTTTPEEQYYIENRGISITGKVTETVTGQSLPYTRVNLSILGRGKDFMSVQTGKSGRFFFQLPDYTGNRDLFICAARDAGPDVTLLIDNDFCTAPVMLPSGISELTEREREVAFRMAVNVQLGSVFYNDTTDQDPEYKEEARAFYGTPDDVLQIDDYIELPTLEEYFNGLPTLVRIRKNKQWKRFRMITRQAALDSFDPLVLVDLVAIDDPERILAINPSNLSRIEVVNKLYQKGDVTFGGIISLISRHGDFAGIDLPESGIFINYGFLYDGECKLPKPPAKASYPDTRNTLLWEPDLKTGIGGGANIILNAPDLSGRYTVILSGVTSEGERIREINTFEVAGN